mmetsp:Transcript_11444/g.26043  ORF Transcript_11444/g.26043 Transcript_11444/m.26043 type:complete len:214 (-) Transcript_11444:118-759(-)
MFGRGTGRELGPLGRRGTARAPTVSSSSRVKITRLRGAQYSEGSSVGKESYFQIRPGGRPWLFGVGTLWKVLWTMDWSSRKRVCFFLKRSALRLALASMDSSKNRSSWSRSRYVGTDRASINRMNIWVPQKSSRKGLVEELTDSRNLCTRNEQKSSISSTLPSPRKSRYLWNNDKNIRRNEYWTRLALKIGRPCALRRSASSGRGAMGKARSY